jgi:lysophospholipase L1-like esterase
VKPRIHRSALVSLTVGALISASCATGDRPYFVDNASPTTVVAPCLPLPDSGSFCVADPVAEEDAANGPIILGDSLTVEAYLEIKERVPDAVVDAWGGRAIVVPGISDTGLSRVKDLPTDAGHVWVIALGTNDAVYLGYRDAQLRRDVLRLLDEIGPGPCVWWITPHATPPIPAADIESAVRFAEIVRTAVEARPCGGALAWRDIVEAEDGLLIADGVHLTDRGAERFAELVAFVATNAVPQ